MHQGLSTSRLGLALVLGGFCLPLFLGLGRTDLETDEAIYSFAVDRILEIGDWLVPKSSPSETTPFLEKPPLKFWIVAAPIRAGLLPHTEFGLRFWDAVFGGAAFLYVFSIGSVMAGPLCGLVAVLLLFVHTPLLFDHGLRTNNMESALVLSYCGGIWHFLAWCAADRPEKRRLHAVLTGLLFVLGFMTKFVAALFLPLVLGATVVLGRGVWQRTWRDRRVWLWTGALTIGLIAPWFAYAQARFGRLLWDTMFGAHVLARFTVALDPSHREPWSFYFVSIYRHFAEAHVEWLVGVGLVALLVSAVRRRSVEACALLVWATVPVLLISFGSSKLYHYVYPFLPPLCLAVGYTTALAALLARAPLRKLLEHVDAFLLAWVPRLARAREAGWLRPTATAIMWAAVPLAVAGAIDLPIRLSLGHGVLFRSSGIIRPSLVAVLAAVAAGRSVRVVPVLVGVVILSALPVPEYFATFPRLSLERHPLRSVRDCIQSVQARQGELQKGLYVDGGGPIWHPTYYYLRRIQPWASQETPAPAVLDRTLHEPGAWRPSLVAEERFRTYSGGPEGGRLTAGVSPPMMSILEHILFLPGPYTVCSPEAALHGSR